MSKKDKEQKSDEEMKEQAVEEVNPQDTAAQEEKAAAEIAELQAKVAELTDKMLRIQAEAENYKKRTLRDSEDAIAFANKGLVSDLVPTLDALDLAIAHAQKKEEDKAIADGLILVRTTLLSALGKWGLALIETEGKEFDPSVHEACLMEESADVEVDTVAQELQKGYTLNGRVIRAAKVKVNKAKN